MKTINIKVTDATLKVEILGQRIKLYDADSGHDVVSMIVANKKVADTLYNQWSEPYNQMIYFCLDYLELVQIMLHQVSAINEYAKNGIEEVE